MFKTFEEEIMDIYNEGISNGLTLEIIFDNICESMAKYETTVQNKVLISKFILDLLSEEQRILLPREEETLKMMKDTTELLEMAGYSRYEISNFSKPGFESIHNNNYWTGKPYIGLGPSAHSYDGEKTRRANPNDIKGYLKRFMTIPGNPFYSEEHLTEDESREEMIMLRLRTKRGLDPEEFEKRFGQDAKKDLFQKSRNFILHGFMKEEKNRLAFTNEGFMVSDFILSSII